MQKGENGATEFTESTERGNQTTKARRHEDKRRNHEGTKMQKYKLRVLSVSVVLSESGKPNHEGTMRKTKPRRHEGTKGIKYWTLRTRKARRARREETKPRRHEGTKIISDLHVFVPSW
jgi:hypothetical protein